MGSPEFPLINSDEEEASAAWRATAMRAILKVEPGEQYSQILTAQEQGIPLTSEQQTYLDELQRLSSDRI